MKKFFSFLTTLMVILVVPALAVQVIDEVVDVLQDPATQGTPDPNNAFVWPIDLFAENIACFG